MAFANVHITDDEVDRRYQERRAARKKRGIAFTVEDRVDPTDILNAEPGFYYHGVNKKNKTRIAEYKNAGYETVTTSHKEDWAVNDGNPEGAKTFMDEQLLVRIPREKKIDRLVAQRERFESWAEEVHEASKEKINRMYRNEMHGKPFTNIVVDETEVGEEVIERVPRAKKQ